VVKIVSGSTYLSFNLLRTSTSKVLQGSLPIIPLWHISDSLSSVDYTRVWDWFGLPHIIYFAWQLLFVFSPPPDKFLKKKPTLKLYKEDVTLQFKTTLPHHVTWQKDKVAPGHVFLQYFGFPLSAPFIYSFIIDAI
jgi:hypothetical protein